MTAVAAGGAAAAYYVYDRFGSGIATVNQHTSVSRWEKLKDARATWEELQERCARLVVVQTPTPARGTSPKH